MADSTSDQGKERTRPGVQGRSKLQPWVAEAAEGSALAGLSPDRSARVQIYSSRWM
ncbi:MAG: hypothetical protein ABL882_10920 [Sphingopyxis sp.]